MFNSRRRADCVILESRVSLYRFISNYLLAHKLADILRRPSDLSKRQTPLDALQILPRDLAAHDMPPLTAMKLLSSTTLVDTHHGDTNRPGRLADAQPQIPII